MTLERPDLPIIRVCKEISYEAQVVPGDRVVELAAVSLPGSAGIGDLAAKPQWIVPAAASQRYVQEGGLQSRLGETGSGQSQATGCQQMTLRTQSV